jgi:hypothetical protein
MMMMRHVRRWYLDAPFLVNSFKGNVACISILGSFSLRIPFMTVRDYSTFTVHRNFKASRSARCVSAAIAVCRNTDVFNRDCILLTNISLLLVFVLMFFYFPFSLYSLFYDSCNWLSCLCQTR